MVHSRARAILLNARDNVAVALDASDEMADVVAVGESQALTIRLMEEIPRGHKFSVRDIPAGSPVIKYGEVIGVATSDIRTGSLVHVHNLASRRCRGDLHQALDE